MGILWFALIIPILLCIYLLLCHRKATTWWEMAIPFGTAMLTIVICQAIAVSSATSDFEYWGHMAVKAVHEEPFSYDDE
jgi:hypothetical protein